MSKVSKVESCQWVQPPAGLLLIQCDQRSDSRMFLGPKSYTQLYFHGGRSITRILSTQNESACSNLVSASGPLWPHSRPLVLWSSVLPPVQPLLCSPGALQPCHCVTQSTVQGSLYRVNNDALPRHVQGRVRILTTGTFILSTP